MTNSQETKAARKVSAASAANHKGSFEETAFGRRRTTTVPRSLVTLGGLVAVPFVFLFRRLRRRSA